MRYKTTITVKGNYADGRSVEIPVTVIVEAEDDEDFVRKMNDPEKVLQLYEESLKAKRMMEP